MELSRSHIEYRPKILNKTQTYLIFSSSVGLDIEAKARSTLGDYLYIWIFHPEWIKDLLNPNIFQNEEIRICSKVYILNHQQ